VATSCGGIVGGFLEDQTAANERIAALDVSISPPAGESVTGEGRGRRPFKISGQALRAVIKINKKSEVFAGGC
jgi:hypothetical protein